MSEAAANLEIFLAILVTGLSALLALVAGASFLRLRHRRALLICVGFIAFAAQGAFLVNHALVSAGSQPWVLTVASLDLAALGAFYLALRMR